MLAQPATDLEPTLVGEMDVEQNEIGFRCFGDGDCRPAVAGLENAHTPVFERDAHEVEDMRFVVRDEDREHAPSRRKRRTTSPGAEPRELSAAPGT